MNVIKQQCAHELFRLLYITAHIFQVISFLRIAHGTNAQKSSSQWAMSFSGEVKEELVKLENDARHCQIAELAAILVYSGALSLLYSRSQ